MSDNLRKVKSAAATIHVADHFANANTANRQGMSRHQLNRPNMGTTTLKENRPQTGGSTYPNTTSIKASNTKVR